MKCIDLGSATIKISGTFFFYNETLANHKTFLIIITDIQNVLRLRRMRNLVSEVKIPVFETLVLSETITYFQMSKVQNKVGSELQNIQKNHFYIKLSFQK